ncbi:MAG: hypothetical protein PHX54_07730 [Lentimicrobiaceae bacterium]|nr:hypothetical protein [Lentimicrobiaceae bacterium]
MKKLVLLLWITILFSSCNNYKNEYTALQTRYDSLLSSGVAKDTTLLAYVTTFNAIQANFDSIKRAELIITKSTSGIEGEISADREAQIKRDFSIIYDLLNQNKKTIAELRAKLRKSEGNTGAIQQMLDRLTRDMEVKDAEIAGLRDELEKMNIRVELLSENVDQLTAENEAKRKEILEKQEALNTAYYAIGTRKELLEKNVITREGGFAGMGRNKKLKDDFNRDFFTRVDLTDLHSIALMGKKAEVITTHPSTSYQIYKTGKMADSLVIKNPSQFWSVSKYLVIAIE